MFRALLESSRSSFRLTACCRIPKSKPTSHRPCPASRSQGPGGEVWLQKEPKRARAVRRPEGIAVVIIKAGGCSGAGIKACAEACGQHRFKPRLHGKRIKTVGPILDASLQLSRHRVE